MGKFIIDKVLIEKSEKDIKTGVPYNFSNGFNLICGNNEAGKSSLMKFLREGFFSVNKSDKGKIYISLNGEEYRRDIDSSKKTKERCKVFDSSGSSIADFIEKNIDKRYYLDGFTLTLDELCTLNSSNGSLIDLIKDSSGKKLNSLLENYAKIVDNYVGKDGKGKKDLNKILEGLPLINQKISEFAKNESEYNFALNSLKNNENELRNLKRKLKFFELSNELYSLEKDIAELILKFNKKLFENKNEYLELLQSMGRYDSNLELIQKNTKKVTELELLVQKNIDILKTDYSLNITKEEIFNFVYDAVKMKEFTRLVEQLDYIKSEIQKFDNEIKILQSNISKNEYKLSQIDNEVDLNELKRLYDLLESELKKVSYLTIEISNVVKDTDSVKKNKKELLVLYFVFIATALFSVFAFLQNNLMAGIFACCISTILLAYIFFFNSPKQKEKLIEISKKEKNKFDILNMLKKEFINYSPDVDKEQDSFLQLKFESIKDKLKLHIDNLETLLTEKNQYDTELKTVQNSINLLNLKKESSEEKINSLVDLNVACKYYQAAVNSVKSIKDDLKVIAELSCELDNSKKVNEDIFASIKNFILENDINISLSENIKINIENLKNYADLNNDLQLKLEILESKISDIKNKIETLNISEIEFDFDTVNEKIYETKQQIDMLLEEIKVQDNKKRNLETAIGVSGLKAKKTILIDKYREQIKKIFVSKMILELASMAKKNFDKTQPDLVNAQKFLSILTDEKYSVINLEMNEIENSTGSIVKQWNNLSRGTKEQLYLALRLGYASNYTLDYATMQSNGKADLPLIVDDAFVNFDSQRTKNALKCLLEFSKTNQVLFFTCHQKEIVALLEELNADTNVVHI